MRWWRWGSAPTIDGRCRHGDPLPPAQDHIGGIPQLNGADLLVSEAEWQELPRFAPEPRGFLREHTMIPGLTRRQISLEPANDRH